MVYVTHNQIEATTLADRIVPLREGQLEQQGNPVDLYTTTRNRFVAEFIGSPQMNILDAALSGIHCEFKVQIGSQFLNVHPVADQVSADEDFTWHQARAFCS